MIKLSLVVIGLFMVGGISCQTWPTFWFYRRANPAVGVQVNSANLFSTTGFDRNKDIKLVIHGFGSSQFSGSMVKILNALHANTDANVILVDWKDGALQPNYFTAAPNTRTVGAKTADFLRALNLPYTKFHCIGHSLGAHACGFTGKNYKLGRITGLDPAGPLFVGTTPDKRLAVGDADYVDCSHTDSGLGIQQAICDKNYYPNGGKFQDGCPSLSGRRSVDPKLLEDDPIQYEMDTMVYHLRLTPDAKDDTDLVGCSHNRAPTYFAESVSSNCKFTATRCDTHQNFLNDVCKCTTGSCSSMGYCSSPSRGNAGSYHLKTNRTAPYSLN